MKTLTGIRTILRKGDHEQKSYEELVKIMQENYRNLKIRK